MTAAERMHRFLRDTYRYWMFRRSHFRGIYKDFAAAAAEVPRGKRIGYNNEDVAREYLRTMPDRLDSTDYSVLFHLDRLLTDNGTVFDFGGNIGDTYLRMRDRLLARNVKWVVCDVPEVTRVGENLCRDIRNIEFVTAASDFAGSKIDVLLASCSLQYSAYLESPGELLRPLIESGRKPCHLLIDQVPLTDGDGYVTLQNGGSVCYPQYVANRMDFINQVNRHGYELTDSWSVKHYNCLVPFEYVRSVYAYSGLLFSAISDNKIANGHSAK